MQNCDHCDSPGPCWPVLPLTMLALASPANAWQQSLYEDLGSILTPVDGSGPGLEVADLNGDGVVDILKGGGGAFTDMNDTLVVLFGRGDGRFEQSPHPMPAQQEMVMDFALGDVDGDGDLDVFIGLGKFGHPTQDRLWLNDGNGQFSDASVLLPPALNYTASVLLEDLDGDGDLDAVGGNSWDMGPSTYLLLNDGFGSFSDASDQLPSSLGAGVYSLAAVDLDGDGDEDLVLGSGNSNPPCGTGCCDFVPALSRIWINDGQANFAESVGRLPHAGHVTQDIAVGDVDGDGDPDLILGNRGYGDFGHHGEDQLLINDGTGVFHESPSGLPDFLEDTSQVALADLNGDGSLDLLRGGDSAYCHINPSRSRMWLGDGAGNFTEVALPFDALGQPASLEPADVDGDGDLDLIMGLAGQARVLLGDGTGTFVDASERGHQGGGAPGDCALGDVDGDGDVDQLFGDRLLRNDGSGWSSPSSVDLPSSAAPSEAVELADLDGDGDLDAVIARAGPNEIWENDGTGGFQRSSTVQPFEADWTTSIAVGDLDGDGDDDLVFGNANGQNRLWLNDGGGAFHDASGDLPQALDATRDLVLGDVDGDGDLDLVIANHDLQANVLATNDGSARFDAGPAQLPPTAHNTLAVDLGDVDGDGDLDLFLGGGSFVYFFAIWSLQHGRPELWLNDGLGHFSPSPNALPEEVVVANLKLDDVDGDGGLDVVVAVPHGTRDTALIAQQTLLWSGNGAGVFTATPERLADTSVRTWGFAVGDIDEDGDLDILDGSRVQRNVTRHLTQRSYPRVGYPLELKLFGAPGEPWILMSARSASKVPYGDLGTLLLERANLVLMDRGILDAEGRASTSFDIPSQPALVGMTIHWQAFIAGQDHLTNLERTTLSGL